MCPAYAGPVVGWGSVSARVQPDGPRFGGSEQVAWITEATTPGSVITAAIPPVFARYATIEILDEDADEARSDAALLEVLRAHTPAQPWWLGYLDTGVADLVFPHAPQATVYWGWRYVLVEAGPDEAGTWRRTAETTPWHSALPELLFPADRAWLVSTMWDDDWRCVGGSTGLVTALLQDPALEAREVALDEDATPPGHRAT